MSSFTPGTNGRRAPEQAGHSGERQVIGASGEPSHPETMWWCSDGLTGRAASIHRGVFIASRRGQIDRTGLAVVCCRVYLTRVRY